MKGIVINEEFKSYWKKQLYAQFLLGFFPLYHCWSKISTLKYRNLKRLYSDDPKILQYFLTYKFAAYMSRDWSNSSRRNYLLWLVISW